MEGVDSKVSFGSEGRMLREEIIQPADLGQARHENEDGGGVRYVSWVVECDTLQQ